MIDNVIRHTDFKQANHKAERAFWLRSEQERQATEIENVRLIASDTAPCELNPAAPE